jgi:hypothetical protein
VSTAFEKTFSQRSDTVVVHEPFTDCYFFSRGRKSSRYGDCEELLDYDGNQAIQKIRSSSAPIVFCKELAFQALPYINQNFLESSINTFIIRHPMEVLASMEKIEPDFPEEEFGFDELDRIWTIVTEILGQPPILVEATRFRRSPETILRRYCEKLGIEFMPQMLSWEDGKLMNWKSYEADSQAKWHNILESSTTILPPTAETKVEIHPERAAMMERAVKIYEKLSSFAL